MSVSTGAVLTVLDPKAVAVISEPCLTSRAPDLQLSSWLYCILYFKLSICY